MNWKQRIRLLVRRRWSSNAVASSNVVAWLLLILLALFLRTYQIQNQYATRDECFSWRLIQYPLGEQVYRMALDVHPPLYYVLLTVWSKLGGLSMHWLRLMSVLISLATIPLAYVAVGRSVVCCRRMGAKRKHGDRQRLDRWAAWVAAVLAAIHVTQLDPARNARMYSLGVFLSWLSSWFLVEALSRSRTARRWWIAYGVAAGWLCHTHNYGLLTVAGQACFVVVHFVTTLIGRRAKGPGAMIHEAVASLCVALLIYGPWLPILHAQTQTVGNGYWIQTPSVIEIQSALFTWFTGMEGFDPVDFWCWLMTMGTLVVLGVCQGNGQAMCYWGVLGAVPWVIALLVSMRTDTAIFQLRYMAFAHVGFVGMIAACLTVRHFFVRLAMTMVVISTCGVGTCEWLINRDSEMPAIARALAYVARHHRSTDRIVLQWYGEVNRIRYYAGAAGIVDVDVRYAGPRPTGRGHAVHVASLDVNDFAETSRAAFPGRTWHIEPIGSGWTRQHSLDREFRGPGDNQQYRVSVTDAVGFAMPDQSPE